MSRIRLLLLLFILFAGTCCFAQQKAGVDSANARRDSLALKRSMLNDSLRKKHVPRKATIRSAIIPGWGQAYNGKYWKIPLVYGALGITGGIFNFNLQQYRKVRFAYITLRDTVKADYDKVADELKPFIAAGDLNSLRNYRDEFRKNIDYSVLFFLFFWGLNVVDATVDAHLKEFDVSKDLSLKIKPTFNAMPTTIGLSLVLAIK